MDALKDSDLLHWKHSLSELIDISIAQKTAIWRLYGRRYLFCLELLDWLLHLLEHNAFI